MNPFSKPLAPLPPGAAGEREFPSAQAAETAARSKVAKGFVILQAPGAVQMFGFRVQMGSEFAWLAPVEAWNVREVEAKAAGIKMIKVVE